MTKPTSRDREAMFRAHYKWLPDPIYTWKKQDDDLVLIDYNHAAERITKGNVGKLLGIKLTEMYKDRLDIQGDIFQCLNQERIVHRSMRYDYQTIDKVLELSVTYAFIPPDYVLVHTEDITARVEAENKRKESEEKLRFIAEQLPAILWTVDKDLCITMTMGSGLKAHNLKPGDLVGISLFEYLKVDDPGFFPFTLYKKALEGEPSSFEAEWDGSIWDIYLEPWKDINGAIMGCIALAHDITGHKQAEEKIKQSREKLRAQALRLQEVREEESKRIARIIHDELGQILTGLRWDLTRTWKQFAGLLDKNDKTRLEEKVNGMTDCIDETIQRVREISSQLRPLILDDLGLIGAFEWQIGEFEKRTGIACELVRAGIEDQEVGLDSQRSTAAFRIMQEILTNIQRHAGAHSVRIKLESSEEELKFEVRDDGGGIPPEVLKHTGSLGILGMHERAEAFGGSINIKSETRKGTSVRVCIPVYSRPKSTD